MGNDGGSIPTRRELVKEAARNPTISDLKEKQKEHLAHRWSQCPISHKALTKPVVSDCAGDLYNKDAIIQFLLPDEVSNIDKVEVESFIQGRVKSLKDIVEVLFEVEHDSKTNTDKWICPVTSKELGPSVKAVYLVPCGHAFSQEAIKEMKSNECVQCNQTYETRDIVPILPRTESDKAMVIDRMKTLKELGLAHSLKKASGNKKRKVKEGGSDEAEAKSALSNGHNQTPNEPQRSGNSTPKPDTGIKNSATASLTAKVLEEEAVKKKRRLLQENDNIQSIYSKTNGEKQRDGEFMTRGFSIAANAKHK